jgi:polar amino acid transport system substrate-binding protein
MKRSGGPRCFIMRLFGGSAARVMILLAAVLLPATAHAQQGGTYDLQNIIKNGVLRVAVTRFDLPAFHWHENGELRGPEIEFVRQIARALDIKVEFVESPDSFNAVIDAVAAGDADIGMSKLSQTYARLTRVRFSQPYITLRHGLLFDRQTISAGSQSRAPAEAIRVFKGRIGVIQRSAYVDFGKRKFPGAQVVETPNWNAAIDDLLAHRVDAIYRDEFEIRRVLKNRPALNVGFGVAIATDQQDFLSIAICKNCAMLQEFVNYHITQAQGVFSMRNLLSADLRDR